MRRIICFLLLVQARFVFGGAPGTWVDLTIDVQIQQLRSVSALTPSKIWAAGDFGTVIYTSNEGASWQIRGNGQLSSYDLYSIAAIDSLTALCAAHNPVQNQTVIFRTSNGGQQWFAPFTQQNGWIEDIKMINATSGYAYGDPVGGRWTLLRTSNGGNSWDSTGMYLQNIGGGNGWPNAMFVYDPGVGSPAIWFGTSNSIVYKSSDGGFNWTAQNIPAGDILSIVFMNANTGFCGANNAGCGTTNGGQTWTLLSLPGSGEFNSFVFNSGFYWYSRSREIYYSSNSGASFSLQHTSPGNTPYQHMSFSFSANNNVLSTIGGWAITGKSIISHYKDPSIGIQQIGNEIPNTFELKQNYPNPFNPVTTIKFDISNQPEGSKVKLVIYDILGNQVAELLDSELKPGRYQTSFDASNYPSGIYFYKMSYSGLADTKKMILLR